MIVECQTGYYHVFAKIPVNEIATSNIKKYNISADLFCLIFQNLTSA